MAHVSDKPADKAAADKSVDKLDAKSGETRSEGAKPAEAKSEAAVRIADKHRSRDTTPGAAVPTPAVPAPIEHEPGVADAAQTRVADAGH